MPQTSPMNWLLISLTPIILNMNLMSMNSLTHKKSETFLAKKSKKWSW